MTIQRVGFVGIGTMGSGMARNMAKKGFEVTLWNRTKERAEALKGERLTVASSLAELVGRVDGFCTCLSTPAVVEETVFGANGLLASAKKGQFFIDFSTGPTELAKKVDAACRKLGVDYLDAPVTGSKTGAAEGTLIVMAGGEATALERLKPLLASMSQKVVHCGPAGAGSQIKLSANALIAAMLQAFSEGLLLTSAAGLNPATFLEVVQSATYRSPYYDFKGKALLEGDTTTNFRVDLMLKDLTLMVANARSHGVPTPSADNVQALYRAAVDAGKGALDIASVISVLEESSGHRILTPKRKP